MRKIFFLASSLLLAFTSTFAVAASMPIKAIHFTIDNQSGAAITNLVVYPGITNLTPTQLTINSLPIGITNLTFNVVNQGKEAGVALGAGNPDKGQNYVFISGGSTVVARPQKMSSSDQNCFGQGSYSVVCVEKPAVDIDNVHAKIMTN
ncbi:MAG: hypothetical protein NTZ67_04360 [Gammaproteobacteria bacterium]|nr:hypothetical protein [Gammaproteobacteria bacterium]